MASLACTTSFGCLVDGFTACPGYLPFKLFCLTTLIVPYYEALGAGSFVIVSCVPPKGLKEHGTCEAVDPCSDPCHHAAFGRDFKKSSKQSESFESPYRLCSSGPTERIGSGRTNTVTSTLAEMNLKCLILYNR